MGRPRMVRQAGRWRTNVNVRPRPVPACRGAAVVLVALVALAVTQLGPWWRGTKQLSLDTSPHGWSWGATSGWAEFSLGASAFRCGQETDVPPGVGGGRDGVVWSSVAVLARASLRSRGPAG